MAKSRSQSILLLNCRNCDDILRLNDDVARSCLCGQSKATIEDGEVVTTGPSRIFEIDYEQYDGAAPGENKIWRTR